MYQWSFEFNIRFLEDMITKNMDNTEVIKELLLTYREVVQRQSDINIQYMKSDEALRKEFDKNQVEHGKIFVDFNKR